VLRVEYIGKTSEQRNIFPRILRSLESLLEPLCVNYNHEELLPDDELLKFLRVSVDLKTRLDLGKKSN
jgi:hypothetical protein